MSKNSVSEWSTVSSGNGDIAGITLGLDMPPSYVNNAMQEMMAQIKQWKDGYTDPITGLPVYQSLTVENIDVEGVANFKGGLKLDGSYGTNGQVLVSSGSSATPTWGDAFVRGMIMIWSGSIGSVPSGWRLCDGGGGTPDLRNRFVMGAGNLYGVGATGGANTRSTSATAVGISSTTLVVSRDGWGTEGGPLGRVTAGRLLVGSGQNEYSEGLESIRGSGNNRTLGAHSHTSGGHSHAIDTRSPYYALAYIMKL